jgi:hypothetical protein
MYARGLHNSAWVGITVAYLVMTLLSLPGFYLVKNAIERDRRMGVGEIIAATPLSKLLYIVGKWFSNLAILGVMVVMLAVSALVMQLWRAEELHVDLWDLWSPFLIMTLPVIAIVAALAILFETIPWLQGGLGNIVYFFLWITMMATTIGQNLLGSALFTMIAKDFVTAFPDYRVFWNAGINPVKNELLLLPWEGIHWTSRILLERLAWTGVAFGIVLLAALFFTQFDPDRRHFNRSSPIEGNLFTWWSGLLDRVFPKRAIPSNSQVNDLPYYHTGISLTPVEHSSTAFKFWRVLWVELRVMFIGQPWWWFVFGLGMLAFSWSLQTTDLIPQGVSSLIGIWPVLVWSAIGVRESRHHTEQLVFSSAHSVRRQLPAIYLAGLIIAIIAWSGIGYRCIAAQDWIGLLAWGAGVLFIPSLALVLGVWSASSKPFEVIYVFLWYAGPMNGIPVFDFVGAASTTTSIGIPMTYLACTVLFFGLAILGRRRQILG